MKRILFVDDEPAVLDGLRDRLRKQRREWERTALLDEEYLTSLGVAGRLEEWTALVDKLRRDAQG
jgi:hypothetical protein